MATSMASTNVNLIFPAKHLSGGTINIRILPTEEGIDKPVINGVQSSSITHAYGHGPSTHSTSRSIATQTGEDEIEDPAQLQSGAIPEHVEYEAAHPPCRGNLAMPDPINIDHDLGLPHNCRPANEQMSGLVSGSGLASTARVHSKSTSRNLDLNVPGYSLDGDTPYTNELRHGSNLESGPGRREEQYERPSKMQKLPHQQIELGGSPSGGTTWRNSTGDVEAFEEDAKKKSSTHGDKTNARLALRLAAVRTSPPKQAEVAVLLAWLMVGRPEDVDSDRNRVFKTGEFRRRFEEYTKDTYPHGIRVHGDLWKGNNAMFQTVAKDLSDQHMISFSKLGIIRARRLFGEVEFREHQH